MPARNGVVHEQEAHILNIEPLLKRKPRNKTSKSQPGHLIDGQIDTKELLRILTVMRNGNFSLRIPIDQVGMSGEIGETVVT